MRRLAVLLMLLSSFTPSMAQMDDVVDDEDWGYYGDVRYVDSFADSNMVCVMDDEGDTYTMRLVFFDTDDKLQRGCC